MTLEEAIKKSDTNWWVKSTDYEIVAFQLFEERLCMPFPEFHKAMESVFKCPIFTHEFGSKETMEKFKKDFKELQV